MNQLKENQIAETGKRKSALRRHLRSVILGGLFFSLGLGVDHFLAARSRVTSTFPSSTVATVPVAEESNQPKAVTVAAPKEEIAPATFNAVKEKIPDVAKVTVERGSEVLRQAAVIDFKNAIEELSARQEKLERQFAEAQQNHSEAQQQAAIQQLRALQEEQTAKLKEIAASSQEQVNAFKQLKGSAQ